MSEEHVKQDAVNEGELDIEAIVGDVFEPEEGQDAEPEDNAEPQPEPEGEDGEPEGGEQPESKNRAEPEGKDDQGAAPQPADPYAALAQDLGMSPDEVREVLEALRAAREKPEEAAAKLEARAKQLKVQHGIELPDDLREEVELGLISEERAAELARMRTAAQQWRQYEAQLRIQQAAAALTVVENRLRTELGPAFDAIAEDLQQFVAQRVAPLVHAGHITPDVAAQMVMADAQRLYAVYQRAVQRSKPKAPKTVPQETDAGDAGKEQDLDAMLLEEARRILMADGDR